MATKIIVPYVYRGKANVSTAATILHAVYQYTQDTDPAGSPSKYWSLEHVITSDGGAPTAVNTHLVLLRNTASDSIRDSFIMMRRLDHLINTVRHPTVACSFHPAGTDFGDVTIGFAAWLSSPNTIQNSARIINFGTNADWGIGFESSSPECYITGANLAIDHFLNSTFGMYSAADPNPGKIDIIETQDSLTVATYGRSGNGFQNLPLVNVAWQHVMHAGDIFTPDNRSDPDTKPYTGENITGEGIMCGWFGHATQSKFIMSTNDNFSDSFARTGKIVNLNVVPNDHEWQTVTVHTTSNHTWSVPPSEENWTYAAPFTSYYLPTFGFTGDADERNERLLPYRLAFRPTTPTTIINGANLLTRFIKQRWRGIGQLEIDGITNIIYGKHANSRYPGSDVSWVHQCSDRRVGGGIQINPPFGTRNNTVHVWRRDSEFVDLNP